MRKATHMRKVYVFPCGVMARMDYRRCILRGPYLTSDQITIPALNRLEFRGHLPKALEAANGGQSGLAMTSGGLVRC